MQTMVSTAGSTPLPARPDREADVLLPGAQAGPWTIEHELGRGGMGAVYAVVHETIGKRAALKVMHRRLADDHCTARILLEARVVNQVGHPNIVDIFETGALGDGRPYIVMERLDGLSLGERADEGKLLPDQVIDILLQICDALIAAHAAGVVHRDLKLDNVFLVDNPDAPTSPRAKLLDWGIAKVLTNDARQTVEGQLVGTPQYLAPEQARGAAVSAQTDVYSLGVMAYELFLEQLPFEAETSAEIMAMHLRAAPPQPAELWPAIPPTLDALLLAMLAKDPDARPTMLEVARTLERVRDELAQRRRAGTDATGAAREPTRRTRIRPSPGFAPTEPAGWRRPNRRWHAFVGALALTATAALIAVTRTSEPARAAAPREAASTVREALAERGDRDALDPAAHLGHDLFGEADLAVHADDGALEPDRHEPPAEVAAQAKPRAPRKAPVKPRRERPLDPDGTLDPYR
jgi:eukaryotic-like serine/threonine-protein kinase